MVMKKIYTHFYLISACLFFSTSLMRADGHLASDLEANVWYVNIAVQDSVEDGTSWETAFRDLQTAIDAAGSDDEIWIAKGEYTAIQPYFIDKGLKMYGGFAGTETSIDQRNLDGLPPSTVFEARGQYQLTQIEVSGSAEVVLDGLFFSNGWADPYGGAIEVMNENPQLALKIDHCHFLENYSRESGGAIYAKGVQLSITESLFDKNNTSQQGGAIHYIAPDQAVSVNFDLSETDFTENFTVENGGALLIEGVRRYTQYFGEILDVVVIKDFITNETDTILVTRTDSLTKYQASQTSIKNCLFEKNSISSTFDEATQEGGAIFFKGLIESEPDPFIPDAPTRLIAALLEIEACDFRENDCNKRGGAISASGLIDIKNSTFSKNLARTRGGAISGTGNLRLYSSLLDSNKVVNGETGGAVYFQTAINSLDIILQSSSISNETICKNNTFSNNTAQYGGAMSITDYQTYIGFVLEIPRAKIEIDSCDFLNNQTKGRRSEGSGGAIYVEESHLFIRNSFFNNNQAKEGYGGAISVRSGGLYSQNNQYLQNQAAGGGAIFFGFVLNSNDSLLIVSNIFNENKAKVTEATDWEAFGGAVELVGVQRAKIKESQFLQNTAQGLGGAIYSEAENLDIENVELLDNSALTEGIPFPFNVDEGGSGGAIFSEGNLTVNRSKIIGNYANRSSGGIFAENIVINHSLLWNNLANDTTFQDGQTTRFGSALHAVSALIGNCTFYNNQSRKSNVQISNGFTGTINNSIIWSEIYTIDPVKDVLSNTSLELNHCIVNRYFRGIQGTNMLTDPLFVDPENGNFQLKLCSPAVNGGNSSLVQGNLSDLNGRNFIAGNEVDIGAYESLFDESSHLFVAAGNLDADEFTTGVSWDCAMPSLSKAIEKAKEGDVIWVAKGTYSPDTDLLGNTPPATPGTQTFQLNKDLEIYGGFAGDEAPETFDLEDRDFDLNQSILDGQGEAFHVVFSENQGDDATLDGFIIQGGRSSDSDLLTTNQKTGAGLFGLNTAVILNNLIFQNNEAGTYGGALALIGTEPSYINNSNFSNNTSSLGGGAIYAEMESSKLVWNANHFSNNMATQGLGGAVFIEGEGDIEIFDLVFEGNNAQVGGALHLDFRGYSFIFDCQFENNEAVRGGAIHAQLLPFGEGNLPPLSKQITECEFPNLSSSTLVGRCQFKNNTSQLQGGAIYLNSETGVLLGNNTFLNNDASEGGALYNQSIPQALIIGNALIANSNADDGAAIFSANDFFLFNSTIAGNSVASTGGIISYGQGKALLCSSIIWGNNGTSLLTKSNLGQGLLGYSIVEGGCNNASYEACLTPTHVLDADPMFRNPNMGDFRLTIGSPAIDAGLTSANESDVDLDGQPRVSGNAIDMGAYETQLTTSTETSLTEKKERIHIFPNPANQQLQITFQLPPREEGQIRILNSIGQQVYTTSFKKGVDKLQIELPEAVKSGLYLLTVSSKDVSYSTRLIVARE
jgi:predicted outer membrane repeat protein